MKREEFLTALKEALETKTELKDDTVLASVEEWDSLAMIMSLALFNKHLGQKVSAKDARDAKTVGDLLNLGKYD
jgi:acyl carrier protein